MSIKKNGGITLAAELLFGLYPQAYIPQLCVIATVVPGTEMGDTGDDGERFIDNKRIEGTLPQMLSEALAFIRSNMKTKTVIDPKTGERLDIPEYPITALREILLNALVHRDYSMHTEGMPIQVMLFADRLEVRNPGGLYGRLTIDQLGKTQPDTRNPVLATALETLGLTENRYSGVPTIRKEMQKANLPEPEFSDTHDSFLVVLKKNSTARSAKPENNSVGDLLTYCTTPRDRIEIATFLHLTSAYAMQRHIMPLVEEGLLSMSIPEKPKSKFQQFSTTECGLSYLEETGV